MSTYYKEGNEVLFRIAAGRITYEVEGVIKEFDLTSADFSEITALGAPSGTAATDIATLYTKVNEIITALKV